jgi:hypothetical protein
MSSQGAKPQRYDSFVGNSLKEFLVAVPLFASTLAVMFDVGYFSGIDINLFTLFSISEHLVFALEALPLGIALALSNYAAIRFYRPITHALDRKVEENPRRTISLALMALIFCVTFIVVVLYIFPFYFLFIFTTVLALVLHFWHLIPTSMTKPPAIWLWSMVFVLVFAYGLGTDISRAYLASDTATHTVQTNTEALRVRLIRSGDKGLLFFVPQDKRIIFLRWDAVKEIARPRS